VRDALYIPGDEDKKSLFESLLDLKRLNTLFDTGELQFGEDAIGARFVNNRRESIYKLSQHHSSLDGVMKDGYTVQLHQPQRFQDNLWRLVASMEAGLHTLVGCNAYLTPKNTQGLAPHWDDVFVVILQMYGEKDWQVWRCNHLPRYPSGDFEVDALGKAYMSVKMTPGDALFLPRGFYPSGKSGHGGLWTSDIFLGPAV
jgi:hypothetical protein